MLSTHIIFVALIEKTMKQLLLSLVVLCLTHTYAQPFNIGHRTITYNDPSRTGGFGSGGGSGRQIQCEVYYPSDLGGENEPIAFYSNAPVIVFGHGFVMSWDAYQNIWEHYVPLGYIMVFPRTEGSFSPSHNDFALDLVVVGNRFKQDCTNPAFFCYDHFNGKSAVMGHSMGGGATFLAAANSNQTFDIAVGLAPAETNPSAVSAGANVSIESLIFSGSADLVTPPNDHHLPIYNALASSCKNFVSITGGNHCYFANANTACDFGESSSGSPATISRIEQHDTYFDGLDPFLDFHLMGNCAAWNDFLTYQSDSRIVSTSGCSRPAFTLPTVSINGNNLESSIATNIEWRFNGAPITETSAVLDGTIHGSGNYTVVWTDPITGCTLMSDTAIFTVVGLNELAIGIQCFPNPFYDHLTIESKAILTNCELVDAAGRLILSMEPNSEHVILNTSDLRSGVYVLKLNDVEHVRLVKN